LDLLVWGLAMLVSGLMQKNNTTDNGFVTIMNDFQFMPKIMKQLWVHFSGLRFFHVDLHRPSRYTTHLWHNRHIHLKPQYGCQVGEMFANYNLIAAIVFLLPIGKIYESFIHTLSHCLRWTWSYVCLFHN
jgi:maltose/moltooligosaccharide transporter